MPETLKVVVTHIENPSKFFFRIFNPEDYKIRREIERKVAEHASVALLESCSKTVDSVRRNSILLLNCFFLIFRFV